MVQEQKVEAKEFVPQIVAFVCWKWGYGAADIAGVARFQYPASVKPIRIPCAGRVSPDLVIRALRKGADAVLIVGWYPGECDYEIGNIVAEKQVNYLKKLAKSIGLDERRIQMRWCSAAEGERFAKMAIEVTNEIEKLGPNPLQNRPAAKE